MRVVFMGTPDFSVQILEKIIEAGHEVLLVVTQPDKPKGRGNTMQFPPVKECALAHGLPVFQPEKIREDASVEYLKKIDMDIIIVAAFGQILPKSILDMGKYGCINVHASLLPKYRGAAPIQWAVINGDEITGVTTMRMDVGVDTGDMIAKKQVRIAEDETGGSLFDKLAVAGARLCVETMDMLENNTAEFTPQNNDASTHTKMITKDLGDIDWNKRAVEIERLIRGLNPWPSAFTHLNNKTFKIWKAKVVEAEDGFAPGSVCRVSKKELVVMTGEGALSLLEVQLEGKKRMDIESFLRGCPIETGTMFKY